MHPGGLFPDSPMYLEGHEAVSPGNKLCQVIDKEHKTSLLV
jgi:hypothetical protein